MAVCMGQTEGLHDAFLHKCGGVRCSCLKGCTQLNLDAQCINPPKDSLHRFTCVLTKPHSQVRGSLIWLLALDPSTHVLSSLCMYVFDVSRQCAGIVQHAFVCC